MRGVAAMREGQKTKAARRLRREANTPEQAAWQTLRRLRSEGHPVRRQHPIGRFVVDFAVVSAQLVIEIDGGIHRLEDVATRDAAREAALKAMGWRVVRVAASEAFAADHLIERVRVEIERSASLRPPSPPTPLPQAGEGG